VTLGGWCAMREDLEIRHYTLLAAVPAAAEPECRDEPIFCLKGRRYIEVIRPAGTREALPGSKIVLPSKIVVLGP